MVTLRRIAKLLIIITCGILIACSRKSWISETVKLNTGIYYVKTGSSVIKSFIPNCDNCNDFYITGLFYEKINQPNYIFVVHTKEDLLKIERSYINSKYLKSISGDFFKNNILGIALVSYTGLRYPNDERIVNDNGKYTFEVDIWDFESKEIPACAYTALYVMKLQK